MIAQHPRGGLNGYVLQTLRIQQKACHLPASDPILGSDLKYFAMLILIRDCAYTPSSRPGRTSIQKSGSPNISPPVESARDDIMLQRTNEHSFCAAKVLSCPCLENPPPAAACQDIPGPFSLPVGVPNVRLSASMPIMPQKLVSNVSTKSRVRRGEGDHLPIKQKDMLEGSEAIKLNPNPGIIWGTPVLVCPTKATDYGHSDRAGFTSGA
jgi:hypothetical protein